MEGAALTATSETSEIREEMRLEAQALHHLLAYHPGRLAYADLDRLMAGGISGSDEVELELVVRDLVQHGLAVRDGDFVVPTMVAVHMHELPDGW
jgi:hypothetical protein